MKERIATLEHESARPEFWQDREHAEKTLTDMKRLRERLEPWQELVSEMQDLEELAEMVDEEGDESMEEDIESTLARLEQRYDELSVFELLSGELDANPCFLTIHSGAGGTEACDWVSMLLRMYSRWTERRGFKTRILDLQEAEGGIKSVTMEVSGEFAYGYLKAESGIHRLVRISPFDSSGRRHTSFASVFASPVVEEDVEVEIKPEDIRVDTYRASGAGGQHVNKTESAVRITHHETGMVVQCQNERSQHKNRATAMRVLRSRLYEYYRQQQEEQRQQAEQAKHDISWGNQIRSYVFHPYNMVKDHRTNLQVGNVQAVMDGDIDQFIEEYLRSIWARSTA
jgi:peptide chain release factor 2